MKRQRLSADIRKKQILGSTYQLISKKVFKSISTRMIADNAGINEALIFRYIDNKENLMDSVVNYIKNNRPEVLAPVPENEVAFFQTLKDFEIFFININVGDPALLKIILYSILENYPLPNDFNINSETSFLNWIYNGIERGKKLWGFNKEINSFEIISMFIGGLIYSIIETSIIKSIKKEKYEYKFTEAIIKILK